LYADDTKFKAIQFQHLTIIYDLFFRGDFGNSLFICEKNDEKLELVQHLKFWEDIVISHLIYCFEYNNNLHVVTRDEIQVFKFKSYQFVLTKTISLPNVKFAELYLKDKLLICDEEFQIQVVNLKTFEIVKTKIHHSTISNILLMDEGKIAIQMENEQEHDYLVIYEFMIE
jgi:hypothetical protein